MMRYIKQVVSAVALLFVTVSAANAAPIYADTVISVAGGSGSGVLDNSFTYAGPSGGGVFSAGAVTDLDGAFWALGGTETAPGTITMRFSTGSFFDGPGADLLIYDSWGLTEGFRIAVSSDGVTFITIGTFSGLTGATTTSSYVGPSATMNRYTTSVDLSGSGVASASYVRLTTANQVVGGYPQAYDLDAIEARNFTAVPEPSSLVLLGFGGAALIVRRRRHDTI